MNEEKIIQKTIQIFKEKKFEGYDKEDNDWSVFLDEKKKLRDGSIKDVYTIGFWSIKIQYPDDDFYERKLLFAVMDKGTEEILYIKGPSGYIELA